MSTRVREAFGRLSGGRRFSGARRLSVRSRVPESVWPARFGRLDIEAGIRAGLCLFVLLMVLNLTDSIHLAAYVAFPAFTALYGRTEAYRHRIVTVSVAGACFLVIILAAMLVSLLGGGEAAIVFGIFLMAFLGVPLSAHMGWIPFGSVFFVFAFSVVATVPVSGDQFWPRLLIACGSVALCIAVAMSGWFLRRTPGRVQELFSGLAFVQRNPAAWRDPVVWLSACEAALGAVVALLLASGLGLSHSYWAAVAVVATVPRPRARRGVARIIHRVIGTTLGVVVTAAVIAVDPPIWGIIVIVAACQFAAELFVARVYWFALLFITPLALLVSRLSSTAPDDVILVDRALDTALGGAVALVLVLAGTGALVTYRQWRADRDAELRSKEVRDGEDRDTEDRDGAQQRGKDADAEDAAGS